MDAQELRRRNRRLALWLAGLAVLMLVGSVSFWLRMARAL